MLGILPFWSQEFPFCVQNQVKGLLDYSYGTDKGNRYAYNKNNEDAQSGLAQNGHIKKSKLAYKGSDESVEDIDLKRSLAHGC